MHITIDPHTVPHHQVYIVIFWNPAIEYSNMTPLSINPAALTNRSHHTLTTQIIPNNTPMLIHINGDNELASNIRMLSATKLKHQRFKLLLHFWPV